MLGIPLARIAALHLMFVASPAFADDPYADFRIPDSQGFRWLVNGDFSRRSRALSRTGGEAQISSYAPSLSTELSGFHDTEAKSWNLFLISGFRAAREHGRSANRTFGLSTFEGKQRDDSQSISVSLNQSWYPGPSRCFLSTSAFVRGDFSQHVTTADQQSRGAIGESRSSELNAARNYGERSTWTLGVGGGRVRFVYGVYDAWDIERRLQANGRLLKPLSPEARIRLAQLSYAGGGFRYAHERSSKYYWREVERILHEDGALRSESLDAYALGRLFENVLPGRTLSRERGISVMFSGSLDSDHGHSDFDDVSTFLSFVADTLVSSFSDRQSQRFRTDRDEFLGGLDVNFQRPVGQRWQFGVRSSARYGAGRKRTTRFTTLAQAGWANADRWSATSSIQYFATSSRLSGVGYPPRWSFNWDNTLDYQIEDAWVLSLNYRAGQDQARFQNSTSSRSEYIRNSSISLGFTYRPAGRFAMPALGIAEHLVPGTR